MVDQRTADEERVAEMHRRHSGKGVDVFAFHPHALRIVVTDRVQKAVLRRQETRRHAGVKYEDRKGKEVREGYGAAHSGKDGMGGGHVVVPYEESFYVSIDFQR